MSIKILTRNVLYYKFMNLTSFIKRTSDWTKRCTCFDMAFSRCRRWNAMFFPRVFSSSVTSFPNKRDFA